MTKPVCIFCIDKPGSSISEDPSNSVIKEYTNWWLVLQPLKKRQSTKQAAGMLITKRHIQSPSGLNAVEAAELFEIVNDAASYLCEHLGVNYTGNLSVGFNQGPLAGQTILHAHIHILPVAEQDPDALKVRGGIGGAFEALRRERLGNN